VELHAVPDDLAGYLTADGADHALNGGVPELPDCATADAHRVVVVLDPGKLVAGSAVRHRQLADGARFQEEAKSPEDGGSADVGDALAKRLSSEAVRHVAHDARDGPPRACHAVPAVFKRGDQLPWPGLWLRVLTGHRIETHYQLTRAKVNGAC
jgi:hypothetical protein